MVDQVQVMSILGRTGGDSGSKSNKAFSDGFAWANLDVPAAGDDQGSSRRALEGTADKCAYSVAAKLVSKCYMTVGILVTVALARALVKGVYVWKFPTDPNPPDLTFPAWEVGCADSSPSSLLRPLGVTKLD